MIYHNDRHSSGCTVAGARPKQALAYPTQHSFLSQMWRTLVAKTLLHSEKTGLLTLFTVMQVSMTSTSQVPPYTVSSWLTPSVCVHHMNSMDYTWPR